MQLLEPLHSLERTGSLEDNLAKLLAAQVAAFQRARSIVGDVPTCRQLKLVLALKVECCNGKMTMHIRFA